MNEKRKNKELTNEIEQMKYQEIQNTNKIDEMVRWKDNYKQLEIELEQVHEKKNDSIVQEKRKVEVLQFEINKLKNQNFINQKKLADWKQNYSELEKEIDEKDRKFLDMQKKLRIATDQQAEEIMWKEKYKQIKEDLINRNRQFEKVKMELDIATGHRKQLESDIYEKNNRVNQLEQGLDEYGMKYNRMKQGLYSLDDKLKQKALSELNELENIVKQEEGKNKKLHSFLTGVKGI